MKLPPYFLETSIHSVLHSGMKPVDVNLILWRIGKALEMVK